MSISSVIKSIQDIMRQDAGVDGDAQRLGQLSWLLFLKVFDAQEEALEFEQDHYTAPIPEKYLWRNWAADAEGMTGDELLSFINDQLFTDLKNLVASIDTNPRGFVVRQGLSDAYNYMKNGTLLRQVINKLNEIDFTRSGERHLFGDIYEQLLRDLQSAGNAGEFYTPRAVTRFIVDRVDPKLGERIMDPACGTGGFLTCSFDHVKNNYVKTAEDHKTLQQQILGFEKKQLPHLLCTTNMMLHGIEVPVQIRHDNTLSKPLSSWDSDIDVIITNPPFGGTEEQGIEKNFPADLQTRETADLFLQLIIELLADQGRAAVVLPDGTLFGEGVKTKLKKMLTDECNLHTIIRLPNGVFNPYTGIKTNLLFFTKGQPTQDIWFYEHPYPAGVKNYSKTRPMKFEEFQAEIDWWGSEADGFACRVENEQAWKVSIEEVIARNFNLDIKNPHQGEVINYDPDELLASYAQQQQSISQLRDQLKDVLSAALADSADANELAQNWARVSEHFATLFTTEQSIETLKQTLLQLAVMGKLVPQDPNDEPAAVLLEKIAAEKAQLIKDKKIKKEKPLPPIGDDEKPFELPQGWEWCQLDALSLSSEAGWSPQCEPAPREGDNWGVLKISAVTWGKYQPDENKTLPASLEPRPQYEVKAGDFLISRANTAELVARAVVVPSAPPVKLMMSDKIIRFVFSENIFSEYINLANNSSYSRQYYAAVAGGTSSSMKNVSRNQVRALAIALPPHSEQHRIVEKLNELMEICDQLKANLQLSQKTQVQLTDALIDQALG